MTLISISERPAGTADALNAVLSFDREGQFPITIRDPFSPEEEERLAWYFERHLRQPFLDEVKAKEAAASIATYGQALFKQVLSDMDAYARYKEALQAGAETLAFEIEGSAEFQHLHWEALRDPKLPQPFVLDAAMVRKNLTPPPVRAALRASPTINLLLVTARPHGGRDMGYRTISRPLVEALRQAGLRVQVDLVRPGTYQALAGYLEEARAQHGAGYYHVIHFDVHGALLTWEQLQAEAGASRLLCAARYGRGDIAPYEGRKAFLALEGEKEGQGDAVEADELAKLLLLHQVPICVLNACQSGMQVGASETSLGARLMQAGVQMVLAMGYSVTVSAAKLLMGTLYRQLFAEQELAVAIRRGRQELHHRKERQAYFNQTIELEDWLLPVVYQNQEQHMRVREFTAEESAAYYERLGRQYQVPETAYGFVGRDLDVLEIEKRLIFRRNLLLVRGMGGAGKTTLLHHLAQWWQVTRWVDEVFYFGYDERAWTRQQIMAVVAERLLGQAECYRSFQPLGPEAQQARLAELLRGRNHLLILDNVESITGSHLAIQNTLPEAERAALRSFLAALAGGKTRVLLGSRGGEEWLAGPTFGDNVYELPGLDDEAASTLAERVLARHGASRYREDADFLQLLKLLDGYPLPIEVVLSNLARQTPAEVLAALQAGDEAVDMRSEKKTESILRCIDYSHSNLSPEAQTLLLCLAPFTGVVYAKGLPQYSERLKVQAPLANLPFERWPQVLQEAQSWGLLSPHPEAPTFYRVQPILPYFLRNRLAQGAPELRQAIETAFREHYEALGNAMAGLLQSREAREKQLGQARVHLEYENLVTALQLALGAHTSIVSVYGPLSSYLDATQDQRRGLELGLTVTTRLEGYAAEELSGSLGVEFVRVLGDTAGRYFRLKQHGPAQASYKRVLSLLEGLTVLEATERVTLTSDTYHNLGAVAAEQRQWVQAESYYQQALAIGVELNDRYSQASTYHQLGMVAQEQRQWAQAESYYRQALAIYIEFKDRYSQASTLHQLGMVAQEQRQWAQAKRYYQRALAIKIKFNDRYSQASTYHNLGAVAAEQRQWAKEERYCQQALAIYVEFNDRYSQASTYHQLGMVAQEQRQWAQAERYYQQALAIFVEFNDRYEQARTYHQLGVVAAQQRQWAQARDHFLKALQTFVDYKDEYSATVVLHNLAGLWRESGDASLPAAIAAIVGEDVPATEEGLRKALEEG